MSKGSRSCSDYLEEVDASLCDHGQPEEVEGRADADGELVPVGKVDNFALPVKTPFTG